MANTKDQAELKKLITKLTPIVPQSQPQQWLPRSDLAAAVAEIINAVDAAVHRGDYYANETKSQSRKINELVNEKQQLLQRKPAVSQDAVYTARENQGLQRRIGALMCEVRDLKAENAKITALMSEVRDLKAESAALNVENTTWKTFYAQLLPGGMYNAQPAKTHFGLMDPGRQQQIATVGPDRAPLEREQVGPRVSGANAEPSGPHHGLTDQERLQRVAAATISGPPATTAWARRASLEREQATYGGSRVTAPQHNSKPNRLQHDFMCQEEQQLNAAAPVFVPPTATAGPYRADWERERANHGASGATASQQCLGAALMTAPNIAAEESKKRSYSHADTDAAPPAKVPRLDYGHPTVRQAVKATAWTPGDSRVTVPKFGETMFGRPASLDEGRKSEPKSAAPQVSSQNIHSLLSAHGVKFGAAMSGAPALGTTGRDDRRSNSEPRNECQPAMPKFGEAKSVPPAFSLFTEAERLELRARKSQAELALKELELKEKELKELKASAPQASDNAHCALSTNRQQFRMVLSGAPGNDGRRSNSEPQSESQPTMPRGRDTNLGTLSTDGHRSRSEPKEDYKLAESRFVETMFGVPQTLEEGEIKSEPSFLDEVL